MQLAQSKATIKGLFLALAVVGLAACGSGDEAGGGGACANCIFLSMLSLSANVRYLP